MSTIKIVVVVVATLKYAVMAKCGCLSSIPQGKPTYDLGSLLRRRVLTIFPHRTAFPPLPPTLTVQSMSITPIQSKPLGLSLRGYRFFRARFVFQSFSFHSLTMKKRFTIGGKLGNKFQTCWQYKAEYHSYLVQIGWINIKIW